MQIDIQSRSFSLTQALQRYVKKKIQSHLDRRADHIMRVNVRLSDINGPHGGVDKRCVVHLVLPQQADIVIGETQSNLYSAINACCVRARSVLSRKLSRHKRQKISLYNSLSENLYGSAY
ncbi:MAG: HPF/RaiA family ribosome-associated protein [Gammaproteobacteria bacterium]|nr:HPF/RaiA family ribosome-associated protein [Gammaproteobacteria bacterium]